MNPLLAGYCSPVASGNRASSLGNTSNFVNRHDLILSSLGVGTYLGHDDETTQNRIVNALCSLVDAGLNVIDTAPNYRNGHSESAVGSALQRTCLEKGIPRNSLFVSTKVGIVSEYYDSSKYDTIDNRICFEPSFIFESVENSRIRMGVETIDCLYIHNFDEAQVFIAPEKLEEKVNSIFHTMKLLVDREMIRFVGLATWDGLRVASDHPAHVSLADWVQIAASNGLGGHFGFIQLPVGVWAPEALMLPMQFCPEENTKVPALEMARRMGLGVMANSSLYQGELLTVVPPRFSSNYKLSLAQHFVQWTRSLSQVDVLLLGMKSRESVHDGKELMMIPKSTEIVLSV